MWKAFKAQNFITKAVIIDAICFVITSIVTGVLIFTTQYEPSTWLALVYGGMIGEFGFTTIITKCKKGGDNDD